MSYDVDMTKKRCFGNGEGKEFYAHYHDTEWAIPVHDDQKHFEMLILEGAQAGLSWETILRKREGYRRAFKGFDPIKVAAMTDDELEALREDTGIVRNKLKIYGARKNAVTFLNIQREFGSFDKYIWAYVDNEPIVNHPGSMQDLNAKTELSDAISKDLKKRGMTFVGSTIIYAYLQAAGLVVDHMTDCWLYGVER